MTDGCSQLVHVWHQLVGGTVKLKDLRGARNLFRIYLGLQPKVLRRLPGEEHELNKTTVSQSFVPINLGLKAKVGAE